MYDPTALQPIDTTDEDWALAWARLFARDTSERERLSDDEWLGLLEATSIMHDDEKHYRPHEAAATAIETDPARTLSESTLGTSATFRDPAAIAAAIRRQGAWIDEFIGFTPGGPGSRITRVESHF